MKQLHIQAARMLKEKKDDDFIIDYLQQRGVEKYYAEMILENVKSDMSDKRQFYRHLFGGISVILAAFVFSALVGEKANTLLGNLLVITLVGYGVINIARAFILFWR